MEITDQILLNDLKNSKNTAYEQVFKKYYKSLSLKAYMMLEDEMEAEDLIQNLFISMWQKSHYHSVNSSLKAYLFRAVHNQCLMALRTRKVIQQKMDEYTERINLEKDIEQSEQTGSENTINLALNELPAQRQKAFKLVYMENKKYQDAANEMGLSVNSIKTHLKLAVKMLQEKLITFR